MKLFKKEKRAKPDINEIKGVITFFGAHHALKGEKILTEEGIAVLLIPGPREISPNCGTALRFDYTRKEAAESIFASNNVLFDQILLYPAQND